MSGERRCTVPGCDGQTEREPDRAGQATGRPIQVWRCSKCGDVVHYQLQVEQPTEGE